LALSDIAVTVHGSITLNGVVTVIDRSHPLSYDLYLALPDELTMQIEETIYRANPGWVLKTASEQQADEKKVPTNSSADS
jgi:hypothetical protein